MSALKDKVVLITGAGSGLGKESAFAFAEAGAKISICGRHLDNIHSIAQELSAYEDNVLALRADVSHEEEVQFFVNETLKKFGRIDILINNAAVFENYHVADTSLDSWYSQIDNNATSTFLMIRECIPHMRTQKSGRILTITSGLSRQGASGFGTYSASKAAIETLTYSVEEEEEKHGISAVVFNPGVMKTALQSSGDNPKDVAPALLHLAESTIRYPGKVVTIDELESIKQS